MPEQEFFVHDQRGSIYIAGLRRSDFKLDSHMFARMVYDSWDRQSSKSESAGEQPISRRLAKMERISLGTKGIDCRTRQPLSQRCRGRVRPPGSDARRGKLPRAKETEGEIPSEKFDCSGWERSPESCAKILEQKKNCALSPADGSETGRARDPWSTARRASGNYSAELRISTQNHFILRLLSLPVSFAASRSTHASLASAVLEHGETVLLVIRLNSIALSFALDTPADLQRVVTSTGKHPGQLHAQR